MITSLVLTGRYTVGMNSQKKILVDDNILSIEKDIPFVRYRFEKYEQEDFDYIANTMKQFAMSTHLIEINLDENSATVLNYLNNNGFNMAKYIYIDVTDAEVAAGSLDADKLNKVAFIKDLGVDRYMLRDKTTTLDMVHVKQFMKQLKSMYEIDQSSIGVCNSPLSFGDFACLTAVKARELMSIYSTVADVALPSANHQCMNQCGCIRYKLISSDTPAPAEGGTKKTSTKSKKDGDGGEKKSSPKVAKATPKFGGCRL